MSLAAEERSPNHWDTGNVGGLVSSEASHCLLDAGFSLCLCVHVSPIYKDPSLMD